MIVAFNTQYNQFKHNITRTDFIKEYDELSKYFNSFFITKTFQIDILKENDIIFTPNPEIIEYLININKIN